VWEWLFSICCAHSCQALPLGVNWSTTLCENKMRYISLSPNLNAIIGIKSNYCVLLKMVMLHDAIKAIQNGFFVFNKKNCFFQKQTTCIKKTGGLFFCKKHGFSQHWLSFYTFLWFSLDRTIWNKSRHYQFDWMCSAHPEYRSLVLKKLRITDIRIRKK